MSSIASTKTIRLKFPTHIKPIHVPLYGGWFYFASTREEYIQLARWFENSVDALDGEIDNAEGCVSPYDSTEGGAMYLIGVFNGSYAVLCHEVGHLTMFVLERAGVPIDVHTTEAFCYLQGWLFEQIQPMLDEANAARVEAEAEVTGDQSAKALVSAYKGAKRRGGYRVTR